MNRILIIDDEEKLRGLLARIISAEGFEVIQAADCRTAWKKLEQPDIDIVLCDVKLPDGNGVDLLKEIKRKYAHIEVILLTAYGNIPDSVQAIKNGAYDYITKGDDNNKIIPLLHRVADKISLTKRLNRLQQQVGEQYSFKNIIGASKPITAAVELAKKVAETNTTVLLLGETGTGKEVFAQAIHHASPRSAKPFVAVNCSAFSKELLESEMFGHKAGAFTGAVKDKKGLFEEAGTGTIFLDEVGEMSPELQAKLLRVLETGEFIKVGEAKTSKTDVRIIAATHRDLASEITTGNFRRDLYYRLSVFQIKLPALRERVADIEPLARHFVSVFTAKTNKKPMHLAPDLTEALKRHQWPGNIRELKNVMERCVILATGTELTPDLLPFEIQQNLSGQGGPLSAFSLQAMEKLHIQKVLNYTGGNKTEAAKLLGIGAATLYRKIEEYKL